ncbi:hypothetical protein [Neobacillus sp. FSL H8-0543]|uniref:hypothetical protein n=1 Tax=Neobacillus sp. FSL H8-0543 TaxID=2954672 RepID=UPI0031597D66
MKLRKLVFALALFLTVPGFNSANAEMSDKVKQGEDKECDCEQQEHMQKDWQAKIKEREKNLLSWVDQYTPDKKAEWTKVLEEKKALRNQWLSPEFAEKREKWKQEKMSKIQDLKKQFEEGKLTKEEFVKQAHGGKDFGHFKTYHELNNAVAAKDKKQAAALLNQLLEQSKQHNEKMKEMMNK